MPKYHARLIHLGRVIGEQDFSAPDNTAAYNEAHPEKMDPLVQADAGELIRWVEVTRIDNE